MPPRTGRLFYVIGASGAGKDSLLRYARSHLPAQAKLVFAHRYITRPAAAGGENHIALSPQEFSQRDALGCFAMHWHSHGLDYGIGREIEPWLDHGIDVVVNGSRAYLAEAASRYPQLCPILIQAPEAQLRARLLARGRESAGAIEQRISQARQLDRELAHSGLPVVINDGRLESAGERLLQILLSPPTEPR